MYRESEFVKTMVFSDQRHGLVIYCEEGHEGEDGMM